MHLTYPQHLDPTNLHDLTHRVNSSLPVNTLHNLQTNYSPSLYVPHYQVFIHTELFLADAEHRLANRTLSVGKSVGKTYQQDLIQLLNTLLKMRQLLQNQLSQLNSIVGKVEDKLNPTSKQYLKHQQLMEQTKVSHKAATSPKDKYRKLRKELKETEDLYRTNTAAKETARCSTASLPDYSDKTRKGIDNFFKQPKTRYTNPNNLSSLPKQTKLLPSAQKKLPKP